MVKIPYGTSNFEKLIEQGFNYIDRTQYIASLEDLGEQYIAFLRPRRFGKSLFVSTLHHYYGLEYKEKFDILFGDCYIGRQPTPLANAFMVLKFDFSGIHTETLKSTYDGFLFNIKSGLRSFIHTYKELSADFDFGVLDDSDSPNKALHLVLDYVNDQHPTKKVYILIDEYDHFANELIAFHFKDYQDIVSRNGYVRKFYEAIKIATGQGVVDRIFITGVSPITLDSFTSGFNISRNLTLDLDLHQMMGFTADEVAHLMQGVGVATEDIATVMEDLKTWYNGYLFNEGAPERLYNPDMVLYFALEYQKQSRYPKRILDTNIASDYGKLHRMFRIGEQDEQHYAVIEALLVHNEVAATLTQEFSFEKIFTQDDFISLLFYMGLLSIKEEQLMRTVFRFPNYVIQELYYQYFTDILLRRSQLSRSKINLDDAVEKLALNNEIQPFVTIIEQILTALSNRDSMGFDEKHVKSIITSLLYTTGIYTIKNEYETDRKYVDLLLKERPPIRPNYTFAIELKYLKKSEAHLLGEITAAGKAQLSNYLLHDELKKMRNLKAWLLIFVGTEAKAVKEIGW